ncbi:MAG: 3-phosphoshikimate 1-carboxyvinyltransferase [Chloroflexi bacterium RBG_16_58_14]|nr:MAG: 3-phosphoshikimate 1-carboxyvinyltransferase [Chloroflexi bacterium RBG_16_58_14]
MSLPIKLTITPGRPLRGSYTLPGDKSLSHRSALFAAMAEGESCIENFLVAGVTRAMLEALTALGVAWHMDRNVLRVQGRGLSGWQPPRQGLDCGNSATTLRLLAGALAAAGIPAVLDGSAGLRRRPMGRIVEPLHQMGVPIEASPSGTAPLVLHHRPHSQPLSALNYTLPVSSAQVKSCLLLGALAATAPTTLSEPGPSRDHTERMLNAMGVLVESSHDNGAYLTRLVPPVRLKLEPLNMTLPGDMSAAAFLIVAALITPGSEVRLCNVGLNPTRTGLLEALGQMRAQIEIHPTGEQGGEPTGDLMVRYSTLQSTTVSGTMVVQMIDEFPAFALAAAFARGETIVSEAEELRFKESDRISVLVGELNKLGVQASENQDGFTIRGGRLPSAGQVEAHGDHRLAMALALAGLAGQGPVAICGAHIIAESFPEFPTVLRELGADIQDRPEA